MDMMSYLMGRNSGGAKKGVKIEVVTELPETGEANVIYLVPKQDEDENNVFDEYIWINDDWELIGTTDIDISGKQDIIQFSTMPTADSTTVGKIIQYTGTTTNDYTNGYFYVGTNNSGTYGWNNINVQVGSSDSDKLPIYDFLSSTQIGTISQFGTTLSADDKTMFAQIINDAYLKGHHSLGINFSFNENYGSSILFANIDGNTLLQKKPTSLDLYSITTKNLSNTSIYSIDSYMLRINMTWNDNVATVSGASIFKSTSRFITTTNEGTYTPTSNYHPATKKYVDDSIAAAITTTLGGSF